MPLSHAGHLRVGSKRDTSGEDLSELSGLPLATSAVSAGDVGDGVTDTRDGWFAGASCGVTTTFDLANGTAGAKRNSPGFFFTLLDSGKTTLGCESAGKLWPFNFRNSSGGSWLMSAGAVPLSFTIWGLLPTVPLSNCVKTPCPEFKSHLKGEIALMFLATKRINSALPSTRMNPCTTGPRSNPMWMKVHSTFLVESGECWRIESGISARTWAPNKVQTGLDNFYLKPFPMDFCLNLLMLKNDCYTKPNTSKHQPILMRKHDIQPVCIQISSQDRKGFFQFPDYPLSCSNWTMLLGCGSTNGERVATTGISNDLSHCSLTVGVDINWDSLRSQAKMLKPYNDLSPGCFDIFSNHHIANTPRHHLSQHKDLHRTWKLVCNDLTCCVEKCKVSLNWNLFPVTSISSVLKDGTTFGPLQTIRIEWDVSLSPMTCKFTVVASRHSCDRQVMSITHSQIRPVRTTTTNIWMQTNPRTIGKISNIKTMHSKLFVKRIKTFWTLCEPPSRICQWGNWPKEV